MEIKYWNENNQEITHELWIDWSPVKKQLTSFKYDDGINYKNPEKEGYKVIQGDFLNEITIIQNTKNPDEEYYIFFPPSDRHKKQEILHGNKQSKWYTGAGIMYYVIPYGDKYANTYSNTEYSIMISRLDDDEKQHWATKNTSNYTNEYGLGVLHFNSSNYDKAIHNFETELKKNPDNTDAKIRLAVAYYKKNQIADARNLLKGFDLSSIPFLGLYDMKTIEALNSILNK